MPTVDRVLPQVRQPVSAEARKDTFAPVGPSRGQVSTLWSKPREGLVPVPLQTHFLALKPAAIAYKPPWHADQRLPGPRQFHLTFGNEDNFLSILDSGTLRDFLWDPPPKKVKLPLKSGPAPHLGAILG